MCSAPRPTRGDSPPPGSAPVFLAGPTAVGKSEVALLLAERLPGEIVSVDSMQVYRGLDVGTAKPSAADQARVRHHLIDVAGLEESFDAARFSAMAASSVAEIAARGRVPVFCGGTGLYFKAFLEGLGHAPASEPNLRAQLEAIPLDVLLGELAAADPVTYERIDRQNPRRVVRAVEVIRLTGKPFSEQRADWALTRPGSLVEVSARFFVLLRRPEDLSARIDARVERMFALGLVAETEALLRAGLESNRTAMQAIGYRQVVEHLRGERSLPDTIALIKQRTRQFAKRQLTWFKRQLPGTMLWLEPGSSADQVAAQVMAQL